MDEVQPLVEKDPTPPNDSILPREYETFEEWDRRIMRMLREFQAREGRH